MSLPQPDIYSNYYIMQSYGGWSPCIQGNNAYGLRPFAGSVLPNCTGFITGYFNEMLNEGYCHWFGSVNGNQLLPLGRSQGLPWGTDPVVGAVIGWDDGGNGHAAIVSEIISSTEIETYESGYNYDTGPCWHIRNRHKVGGVWEYKSGYTWQGYFVYPPGGSLLDDWQKAFPALISKRRRGSKKRWK